MSYSDDELLPLSGLQHLIFCARQAALIHVEGLWADNAHTILGSNRHHAVHESAPRRERRGDILVVRGLRIRSTELGVAGIADVVEFRRASSESSPEEGSGVTLPGTSGVWVPYPVEYKKGRPKVHRADEVQLCAQAICLEEMLDIGITMGALFYGKEQRRVSIRFDQGLRCFTHDAASRFHQMVQSGATPSAKMQKKCRSCSLVSVCMPERASGRRSVKDYISEFVEHPHSSLDDTC